MSDNIRMAGLTRRVPSIDALRGLVMILMALDHTRDFLHSLAMTGSPENLATTTPVLFFTRWFTHFCAPVFMFTAGLGAWFWVQKPGRSKSQLSKYLIVRGLWLVLLDLTVIRLIFYFNFLDGAVLLEVLWALGWSMVILAALVHLPLKVLAPLSLAVIVFHNLLDRFTNLGWFWNVIHQLGFVQTHGVAIVIAYPLVPWFAVMAAGYCYGKLIPSSATLSAKIGWGMIAAFFVLRWLNIYGDPSPRISDGIELTILSFLRCTKYPPSLDFLLMTLGPALVVLSKFDRMQWSPRNPLIVFGREPLFYFIAHLFTIHAVAVVLAFLRYGNAWFVFHPTPSMGGPVASYPADYGYSLGVVYLIWIAIVALMYPLCLLRQGQPIPNPFANRRQFREPAAGMERATA